MKFEIGDKVIVNHLNEEGQIVELLNDKMAIVSVHGVNFPVYIDQLEFPYLKRFSDNKNSNKKEKIYIDDIKNERRSGQFKVEEGIWVAVLPQFKKDVFEDDIIETLKIYLINQTDFNYRFSFWLHYKSKTELELKNEICSLSDFYLVDLPFERLNDSPNFDFEFSLLKPDPKKIEYYETSFKPKGKQIFKKIEEMKLNKEATFSFQLFKHYPDREKKEMIDFSALKKENKVYDIKEVKKHLPPAQSVIDLHIEKLHDHYDLLSGPEIFDLQLKTFEKYLELAQLHHLKTFTVIHGIGNGRLREAIHERLYLIKGVKSFVNQYHPWYGYGATEIFL